MMTLEAALRKIAIDHDLTSVSVQVNVNPVSPAYAFHATCHWDGFSRRGIRCNTGDGHDATEALQNMISAAREDRTHGDADIPVLMLEGFQV